MLALPARGPPARLEPADIFETPCDHPLSPHCPLERRSVELLTAFYRTAPDAARRLIPLPLEPAGAVVIVPSQHRQAAASFGDDCESAGQLPVRLPGTEVTGAHSP